MSRHALDYILFLTNESIFIINSFWGHFRVKWLLKKTNSTYGRIGLYISSRDCNYKINSHDSRHFEYTLIFSQPIMKYEYTIIHITSKYKI